MLFWIIFIIAFYCLLSFVLNRFPIQKILLKEQIPFPVAHIGHRGGGGDEPENSLRAFRRAFLDHQVDVLELDVRYTKDNVIVILHDGHFERISMPKLEAHSARQVHELNFEELPKIHGKEVVCKLVDLLDDKELQNVPICLDFKIHNNDAIIHEVYEMFKQRHRLDKLVWGSFDESTRRKCVTHYPEVPTYFSLSLTIRLYLYYFFGLLPFMPLSNKKTAVMMCSVLLRKEWFDRMLNNQSNSIMMVIVKTLYKVFGYTFIAKLCESPNMVGHLKNRGVRVCYWTVNTEEDLIRVRKSGASGLITDFPSRQLHKKEINH